ncbi:SixA phosphatase family protein [Nocardia sp. NPDC127579]|uniref:SixA phosphatase family protein n=1 Tax=Nocardia sp. NPDC127579 TaxID=3345402 RepID=UPI00363C17C8
MVRTLILMRHGKSDYPEGVADHERPLATRGLREAGLAGQWLRETQPPIDAVRCSTSLRTRETLAATGVGAPVVFERGIYEASPGTLIELVQLGLPTPSASPPAIPERDDEVSTLLVIGHAPGMPWTAWELAANRDSAQAIELSRKFPTSALAVLEFDRPWAEVEPGTGELTRFHVPR